MEVEEKILLGEDNSRTSSYLNLLSLCSRLVSKVRENLHLCVFHVVNTRLVFSTRGKTGWGERDRMTDQFKEQGRGTQLEGSRDSEKSHALKLESLRCSRAARLDVERGAGKRLPTQNRQVAYVRCVPNLV